MHVEIGTSLALRDHIEAHGNLERVVVLGVDLRDPPAQMRVCSGAGATFLGCRLEPAWAEELRASGAVIFPPLAERPYRPYRAGLYSAAELLEGYREGEPHTFWERSVDARIYAHYRAHRPPEVLEALAQRLHDRFIEDAKLDLIAERRVVGIMGGHAMKRDQPRFVDIARIARELTRRGYFLVSGGGPGAMEATNLGAWLADAPDSALDDAVATLASAPTYRDPGWFDTALAVRRRHPQGRASLGIPTWFYGHEPSNLFASHIAKYFSNSLREDGLLAIATHGVVFAPGSAGTVQEVFMDACQNHYGTLGVISPMVFVDARFWREELPARPLMDSLSEARPYASMIAYVDSVDAVIDWIVGHPPIEHESS